MRLLIITIKKFLSLGVFLLSALVFLPLAASAAKPSAAAVKFVIIKPIDGFVGTPIAITIEAQNKNGLVDSAYQEDVTLVTDGSATGSGLVDIVNGVGVIQINDSVAEKVNLSLADTQLTGLDVKSKEKVRFSAAPVSPSSGSSKTLTLRTLSVTSATLGLISSRTSSSASAPPAGKIIAMLAATKVGLKT